MSHLRRHFQVTAHPLPDDVPDENIEALGAAADEVSEIGFIPELGGADHVLFYMNEYPMIFGNFAERWRRALAGAASVQIAFNRTIGGVGKQHWLAEVLTHVYFHDSLMQRTWETVTLETPLAAVPSEVLAPPVDLSDFFGLAASRTAPPPVVIGRLAGDTDVPPNAVSLYRRLAAALPDAAFWFMPAPEGLEAELGKDRRFRFLQTDALPVHEFLSGCHIYALTYSGVPVPGPRSLMEAMAAGCAPVTIDREGPRDRIVQGESGLRTNDDDEMIDYIVQLATDPAQRERISRGAVARAREFNVEDWVNAIVAGSRATPPFAPR